MSAQPAEETGPAGEHGEPLSQPDSLPESSAGPAPMPEPESLPRPDSLPESSPESALVPEPVPFPGLRVVDPRSDADADADADAASLAHQAADVDGPDVADPVVSLASGLVTEEGRLDPAVLQSLTEGLREAVSRLQVEGVGVRAGLAEVRGLGALAAVVAAGTQSSIAGYAARWVRADHRCPTGPDVVCHTHREGPLDPTELGALVDHGGEAGEANLGPVMRLNAGTALGRIRHAVALTTTLSRTNDLLAAGEIDEGRAMIIAAVLHDAAPQVAHAVQDVILPTAGQSSRPRLRDRVRNARGAADQAWQKRLADRGRDARFIHPSPSDIPGMTTWAALLPTEDSAVLEAAIRTAAKRLKTEGFDGTFAQARAEAFLDLALHNTQVDVTLDLTVPVETLDEFREDHTHDETGDPLYPDHDTHHANNQTEPEPDVETDEAPEPGAAPEAESKTEPEPFPKTERVGAGDLEPRCDAEPGSEATVAPDGDPKVEPEARAETDPRPTPEDEDSDEEDPVATVGREAVIPAGFLRPAAGDYLRDLQAECCLPEGRGVPVPGLGIIPVHRIRDWLDSLDTGFRRVLIDAATGLPIEVGATRYRPGARLARLIRLRDGTCRFPYCDTRAQVCDLDHVVPHPFGATVPENLMALCRRHHRLKTHTRWEPVLDPDTAHVTWTDPYGQTYFTAPRTGHTDLTVNPDTS